MVETNGEFLRLGKNTWVRAQAIVVIRGRPSVDMAGEGGSEVIVRATAPTNPNAYTVWTEHSPQDIIAAIRTAEVDLS